MLKVIPIEGISFRASIQVVNGKYIAILEEFKTGAEGGTLREVLENLGAAAETWLKYASGEEEVENELRLAGWDTFLEEFSPLDLEKIRMHVPQEEKTGGLAEEPKERKVDTFAQRRKRFEDGQKRDEFPEDEE